MQYDGRQHDRINKAGFRLFPVVLLVLALVCSALITSCRSREGFDNSDYAGLEDIPEWSGEPSVEINGNKPDFDDDEIEAAEEAAEGGADKLEVFTELDKYGRCGSAIACVGHETMPEGERGSIGMIQPSGWHISKYDFIDNGGYLYNRCHLIGWQLTGQNDEERNLITGTRYMNTQGMLPYENQVAEYVRSTGNHVLYRVTPVFKGKDLLARGVEIEAYSLEDKGQGISVNVYCYNVQPGVKISYKDGRNELDESTLPEEELSDSSHEDASEEDAVKAGEDASEDEEVKAGDAEENDEPEYIVPEGVTYVLNNNTMRFHKTDCEGAKTIKEHNREWFYGSRQEAIDSGYVPCGMCNP